MTLPMTWTRWAMVVYAVLMALLGIYGTIKAGEIQSAIGGCGIGAVVLALMFLSRAKPAIGYSIALLVVLVTAAMFGQKFFVGVPIAKKERSQAQLAMPEDQLPKEHRTTSHGAIFFLSAALAICLVSGHVIGMATRKSEATN